MCGHVGIAGKLEYKDEATVKRLLIYDYFRGPDSTGFAAINKDGTAGKIAKIASNPIDLFDTTRFKEILSGYRSSVFIGHNRAATKGVVNNVNAHPYEFGHIIGAHNGTLSPSSFHDLQERLGEKFDVDSQAIFAAIEKFGIDETIPMLQGAWALVWFDFKEGTLNFIRNKERPFWYCYTKEFDHIFWASEWPMMEAAIKLSAPGYELYSDPEHGYRFWQTPVDTLISYDIEILKAGGDTVPSPVTYELKGKAPTPAAPAAAGSDPFKRGGGSGSGYGGTTTSTTPYRGQKSTSDEAIVHLFGNKTAPFAGFLTKDRFDDIAAHGCSWCGKDVEFDDIGISVYERDDLVLCADCSCGDSATSRVYTTTLFDKIKQSI